MIRMKKMNGRSVWALLFVALCGLGAVGREATLVDAMKGGDRQAVYALLRQKANVNQQDASGTTALHWAVQRNDVESVDALLRAGARAETANSYGVTPLELAAVNGHAGIIERLLKAGADPHGVGPGGQTPLMSAARTGDVEAVRVLLAHGAAVNARQRGTGRQTALMWAVMENNVPAIKVLIEAGAEVDAYSGKDGAEEPANRKAATTAQGSSLEQLIARHRQRSKNIDDFTRVLGTLAGQTAASLTTMQMTALHFAVREGHIEAAQALVAAGADVNKPLPPTGMSPLVQAIYNANFEMAAFLIERGADVNASAQGWSPLHQVAKVRAPTSGVANPEPTGRMSGLDLARLLLDRGANPNTRMTADWTDGYRHRINWLGATPLTVAAKGIDVPLIRLLLSHGADVSLKTADELTPLMAAAGVGVWNSGEDFGTTRTYDRQALEAVKLLVQAGNDPNTVDVNGENALHGAAYTGRNNVVEYLANLGVPLEAENVLGWTALRIADGVQYAGFAKHQRHTAVFIRKLLAGRGLPVPEAENNLARAPSGNGNGGVVVSGRGVRGRGADEKKEPQEQERQQGQKVPEQPTVK